MTQVIVVGVAVADLVGQRASTQQKKGREGKTRLASSHRKKAAGQHALN